MKGNRGGGGGGGGWREKERERERESETNKTTDRWVMSGVEGGGGREGQHQLQTLQTKPDKSKTLTIRHLNAKR